jgi:hypothetical protein
METTANYTRWTPAMHRHAIKSFTRQYDEIKNDFTQTTRAGWLLGKIEVHTEQYIIKTGGLS